jgi:hypothetical protein
MTASVGAAIASTKGGKSTLANLAGECGKTGNSK